MGEIEPRSYLPQNQRSLLEVILSAVSVLKQYVLFIGITTGLVAIGVVAYCFASTKLPPEKSPLPNRYTASAVILLQEENESGLSLSILSALGMDNPSSDVSVGYDFGARVLLVLRSRTFIDKVIEEFGIAQRYKMSNLLRSVSRKMIMAKAGFQYDRTTRALTISYADMDPVFARDVTNGMVSLLSDWFAKNMGNSKERESKLLGEKVNEVQSGVTSLEIRLKDLQKKYGVLTAQDLGTSQASALAELRSQLILKEIEIKNYSTITAIEDPKIQLLKEERQNILDLIGEQIQQGGAEAISPDTSASSKSLPDIQLDFNHLSMELDVQRKILNTLSHQYEVIKLASEPEPAFQILELAEVPDVKSGPNRTLIVLEAVAGAFFGSIAVSFLLNAYNKARSYQKHNAAKKGEEQIRHG